MRGNLVLLLTCGYLVSTLIMPSFGTTAAVSDASPSARPQPPAAAPHGGVRVVGLDGAAPASELSVTYLGADGLPHSPPRRLDFSFCSS